MLSVQQMQDMSKTLGAPPSGVLGGAQQSSGNSWDSYNAEFNQPQTQPTQAQQQPSDQSGNYVSNALNATGGFEAGAVKGAMDLPREAASLGQDFGNIDTKLTSGLITPALHSILSSVLSPSQLQHVHNLASQAQQGLQQGAQQTDVTKPQGTAENVGYGAEKIGEFFIPGVGEEGAGGELAQKIASNLPQGLAESAAVGKTADFLGRSAQSGADFAARSSLQQGNTKNVGVNAGIGAAMPLAGIALKGLGSVGGEVVKQLASTLSGVPKAAIEHAITNPDAVQATMRAAAQDGEGAAQKVLQNAADAVDNLKQARSQAFQQGLENLEKDTYTTQNGTHYINRELTPAEAKGLNGYTPGTKVGVPTNLSTSGVKKVFTTTLKDFGASGGGKSGLDFTNVALDDSHISKLNALQNRIYNWSDTSPTGLNRLRQVVDSYQIGGVNLGSSENKFNKIIGDLRTNLSGYLGERVPQIKAMNTEYAAASDVLDNIRSQLKLGSADPNTALRKLLNVFNPKSTVYRPIVQELGEKGGKDLMSDIAGLTMSKWTPEGTGKYISGLLGGSELTTALAHPSSAFGASAAAVPTALMSSPRIVGETATGIGKLADSKIAQTVGQAIPKIAKGATSQILQQ